MSRGATRRAESRRERERETHVLELLLAVLVVLVVVLHGPRVVLPVAEHLCDLLPRLLRDALDAAHAEPGAAALLALALLAPLGVALALAPRLVVLVRVARLGPRVVRVVLDEARHLVGAEQAFEPAVVAGAVIVVGKDVLQVAAVVASAARAAPGGRVVVRARGGTGTAQAAELVLRARGERQGRLARVAAAGERGGTHALGLGEADAHVLLEELEVVLVERCVFCERVRGAGSARALASSIAAVEESEDAPSSEPLRRFLLLVSSPSAPSPSWASRCLRRFLCLRRRRRADSSSSTMKPVGGRASQSWC